jgi:hypothetical protein
VNERAPLLVCAALAAAAARAGARILKTRMQHPTQGGRLLRLNVGSGFEYETEGTAPKDVR